MPELVPGLEGIPIAESAISFVDGENGVLEYRGISIESLAEHSTFEEVSYLLLHGSIPTAAELSDFTDQLREHRKLRPQVIDIIKVLPAEGHPMDAIQAAVAATGMFFPSRKVDDRDTQLRSCIQLIAKLPTMVACYDRLRKKQDPIQPDDNLPHSDNLLYMLSGKKPSTDQARVLDCCLILHADHTMNASTFSARVVGSTLANPFAVVSSAIGALSGPLHGGANERVVDMLNSLGNEQEAEQAIKAKMDAKEKIMGFGHRVYKTYDPRAKVLGKLAVERLSGDEQDLTLRVAKKVESTVTERLGSKGIYPNVDFYSGLVYHNLGIDIDLFTPLFAVARVAGWLAHWLEQLQNNRIFRPRQIYTGQHGVALTRS